MKETVTAGSDAHTLKIQLKNEFNEVKSLEEKGEKLEKVHSDIEAVKASLSERFSSSERHKIEEKLAHLNKVADKYASATSSSKKQELKIELNSELSEVKRELALAKAEDEEDDDDDDEDFEEHQKHDDDDDDVDEHQEPYLF